MISSFFEASCVLEHDSIREFGMKSLDRLMSLNYSDGNGMYHFYDSEPHLLNQLADQIQMTRTLCHAYELTGKRNFIRKAEELMQIATDKLYDKQHGGFFDIVIDPSAPGFLNKPAKPLDENSVAARVLVKLYHMTGKESYRRAAEETLKRFVEIFPQFSFMAADYALAIDAFLNEPIIIRIIGSPERAQTKKLLTEAHRIYEPRKIIQVLNPDWDAQYISALGYPSTNQPTAFVCLGRLCTAPITEPNDIPSELAKLSRST
jgi:uncharacterized protein YyaL (SSP411 family)